MKILLVSDIHVDHIYKDFHIKKIKKIIEKDNPDFVLIAGDMMNKANEDYPRYFNILQEKETPIFAVM
jgi:predicted phosphodiesterase